MPILYRSTPTAPDPLASTEPRSVLLDVEWHGADGSVWHLTNAASFMRLLPGIRGLEAGDIDRWTSEAPGLAGSRYRGHRALARDVFLPVYLRGASSRDWLAVRRAWNASLSPDDEGALVVTVDGQRRTLPCRWVRTEAGWTRDPLAAGKSALGEYFIADGAYWQSDPVTALWQQATDADFFLTSDGVFRITPSNTLGSARIDNPGDVPAWPVWTITGPADSVTVGVDESEIEIPFELAAGQWLRIDTRPDHQTVEDNTGADRVADLPSIAFKRVPAGQAVSVSLAALGTDAGFSVRCDLTPLHRRAW